MDLDVGLQEAAGMQHPDGDWAGEGVSYVEIWKLFNQVLDWARIAKPRIAEVSRRRVLA